MASRLIYDLAEFNKHNDHYFKLRAGINTGAIVAGVIGTHKPFFDIYGDAVNTASRMVCSLYVYHLLFKETNCKENKILISKATFDRLDGAYDIKEQTLEVKGKGSMQVYLVEPLPPSLTIDTSLQHIEMANRRDSLRALLRSHSGKVEVIRNH
jgi:class 3 adenylate cyclase